MKVIVAADSFNPIGGAEISSFDLLSLLADKFDVRYFTSIKDVSELEAFQKNELKGFHFFKSPHKGTRNYRGTFNIRSLISLYKAIKEFNPNIIIFNNVSDQISYSAIYFCRLFGIKTIHVMRDTMAFTHGKFVYNKGKNKFKVSFFNELKRASIFFSPFKFLNKVFLHSLNKVICISEELKRFMEFQGLKVDEVIYNSVTTKDTNLEPKTNEDDNYVLLPGRFHYLKGSEAVIQIFLEEKIQDIKLMVTSEIDQVSPSLRKKCEQASNIKFVGWKKKDEVLKLMENAKLVIYPSIYLEPFGRVPVEAMSRKTPVVVSPYGGLPEIVENKESGFILDPVNKNAFHSGILDILANKDLESVGNKGYENFRKRFSTSVMIKKYIAVIART